MKIYFCFRMIFIIIILTSLSPRLVSRATAQSSPAIVINEIDPGVPDAVEIYNADTISVNLNGWRLKTGDNVRVQYFTLPAAQIHPGRYIVLVEKEGENTESTIYLGRSNVGYTNINWSNSTAGAVELRDNNNTSIDFVKWGIYRDMSTPSSNWTGPDIPLPPYGTNPGRDIHSTDTNSSNDIIPQVGSLGSINNSPPIFLSTRLLPGFVGSQYEQKIDVVGPAAPFSYQIVSGNLPTALTIDSDGYIRGLVGEAGEFNFYLRVLDSQAPQKSAFTWMELETYNFTLTFSKNILLVNGVDWVTYRGFIYDSYNEKAFWGNNSVDFWDCFDTPGTGYPATLPTPRGHGAIPLEVLGEYSVVIWVGNNYNGDLDIWNQTPVLDYVLLGGNLLLMTRRGQSFINEDFRQYLGIQWREDEENTIRNCDAVYPGLRDIEILPYNSDGHTLVAVFSTILTDNQSTLLFKETQSFSYHRGLGVWKKPSAGGKYRASGGQVVFICGRPYRMNSAHLRQNVEFILSNFFNVTAVSSRNKKPMKFSLQQNYPNPFNAETKISFTIPGNSIVKLEVFDLLGHKIKTILDESKSAGMYQLNWDSRSESGNPLASGIYYLKLSAGGFHQTRKMVLVR